MHNGDPKKNGHQDDKEPLELTVRCDKSAFGLAWAELDHQLTMIGEINKLIQRFSTQLNAEFEKTGKSIMSDKSFSDLIEKIDREVNEAVRLEKNVSVKLDGIIKDKFLVLYRNFALQDFPQFMGNMTLVYLVAEFESYLSKVLRAAFEIKPEALLTCQKSMTYEDLLKISSVREMKQKIIAKEISIVNEDIEDINKYINQRFNVDISTFVNWKEFKERFYRRNIIVHNSSIANERYKMKTGYKGKNKRLTVTENYIAQSLELFENMGQRIATTFEERFKQTSS